MYAPANEYRRNHPILEIGLLLSGMAVYNVKWTK